MTTADDAAATLLAELGRLREELVWLRALPPGAVTVEGIVVELAESHPDERTAIYTAWIRTTDRTWRVEQTDTGEGTTEWRKRIRICREPDGTG